jgi:hypothetical protein
MSNEYKPQHISPEQLAKVISIIDGQKKETKKYKITATLQQDLEIIIEADSLEEAQRIADDETITDDFEVVGAVFSFINIVEVEEQKELTN